MLDSGCVTLLGALFILKWWIIFLYIKMSRKQNKQDQPYQESHIFCSSIHNFPEKFQGATRQIHYLMFITSELEREGNYDWRKVEMKSEGK